MAFPTSCRFTLPDLLSANEEPARRDLTCRPVSVSLCHRQKNLKRQYSSVVSQAIRPDFPAALASEKLPVAVDLGPFNPADRTASYVDTVAVLLQFTEQKNWALPIFVTVPDAENMWDATNAKKSMWKDRPSTHQMLINTVQAMKGEVMHGCMHEVRHMTYYAHLVISTPNLPETVIDLDCRPSDCVNVCLRAGVPFYVLGKLAQQMAKYQHEPPLSQAQQHKIKASCMQEQRWHQDPFLMMRLQMQLYISSGLYADAERARTLLNEAMMDYRKPNIDHAAQRGLVAMWAALEDCRWEEALDLQKRLKEWRLSKLSLDQKTSDSVQHWELGT